MCGRNPKCSNITSDTCDTGTCRCGSNAECEDETCISGVCKGIFFWLRCENNRNSIMPTYLQCIFTGEGIFSFQSSQHREQHLKTPPWLTKQLMMLLLGQLKILLVKKFTYRYLHITRPWRILFYPIIVTYSIHLSLHH